jgi:phosphatidylglycerol phospholipase C
LTTPPTKAATGRDAEPSRMPQTIAHRGYKAAFPENTMAAYRNAVDIGSHGVETDIHLSRDGVVVLSHVSSPAPSLEPCGPRTEGGLGD